MGKWTLTRGIVRDRVAAIVVMVIALLLASGLAGWPANQGAAADSSRGREGVEAGEPVPAPAPPQSDYDIGAIAWPLWKQGTHFGWDRITPYENSNRIPATPFPASIRNLTSYLP